MTGLNCEIVSETLSFCIHGTPVKFECKKCHNEHRLTLLESQIKALTDMYKEISCMSAGCQDHRIRQIDENRKVSRRVDEIEQDLINITKPILERLEEIEGHYYGSTRGEIENLIKNNIFDDNEREILEKKVNKLELKPVVNKIPHKCPACEGRGIYESIIPKVSQRLDFTCKTCEGKGIVWG